MFDLLWKNYGTMVKNYGTIPRFTKDENVVDNQKLRNFHL